MKNYTWGRAGEEPASPGPMAAAVSHLRDIQGATSTTHRNEAMPEPSAENAPQITESHSPHSGSAQVQHCTAQ